MSMRLGFISDLHINQIPMEASALLQTMASWILEKGLSHLFIGGDISNHWKTSCQFVENLQKVSATPVYFIPGNHDYWCQEHELGRGLRGDGGDGGARGDGGADPENSATTGQDFPGASNTAGRPDPNHANNSADCFPGASGELSINDSIKASGRPTFREGPKSIQDRTDIDSWIIYRILAKHPQCLLERSLNLSNKLAVVAHSGWYNHAYHGGQFSEHELEIGQYKGRTWQDKRFINWGVSDRECSKLMASHVKEQLDLIDFDCGGFAGVGDLNLEGKASRGKTKNLNATDRHEDFSIILMTHMVTIPEFCVPMPHPQFDYFNAFIATDDFDEIIANYPIRYNFMGHVHYRGEFVGDNDVHYIVNCLGNVNEWRTDDVLTELDDALYILEF